MSSNTIILGKDIQKRDSICNNEILRSIKKSLIYSKEVRYFDLKKLKNQDYIYELARKGDLQLIEEDIDHNIKDINHFISMTIIWDNFDCIEHPTETNKELMNRIKQLINKVHDFDKKAESIKRLPLNVRFIYITNKINDNIFTEDMHNRLIHYYITDNISDYLFDMLKYNFTTSFVDKDGESIDNIDIDDTKYIKGTIYNKNYRHHIQFIKEEF